MFHVCGPPLDLVQQLHIPPVPGTPGLGTVFQMGPHKGRVERDNDGPALLDTFLRSSGTQAHTAGSSPACWPLRFPGSSPQGYSLCVLLPGSTLYLQLLQLSPTVYVLDKNVQELYSQERHLGACSPPGQRAADYSPWAAIIQTIYIHLSVQHSNAHLFNLEIRRCCGTMSKALQESRQKTSVTLPLSIDAVAPSPKACRSAL